MFTQGLGGLSLAPRKRIGARKPKLPHRFVGSCNKLNLEPQDRGAGRGLFDKQPLVASFGPRAPLAPTLKNKLGEYVGLAFGGETVLITDRDRVVAEIGPLGPARSPMQ